MNTQTGTNLQSKMYRSVWKFPDTVERKLNSKERKKADIERYKKDLKECKDYIEARSFAYFIENAEKELFGKIITDVHQDKYLGRFEGNGEIDIKKRTIPVKEGRTAITDQLRLKMNKLVKVFGGCKLISDMIDPHYPNLIHNALKCRTIKNEYLSEIIDIHKKSVIEGISPRELIKDYDLPATDMICLDDSIIEEIKAVLEAINNKEEFQHLIGCTRETVKNMRDGKNDKIKIDNLRAIEREFKKIMEANA